VKNAKASPAKPAMILVVGDKVELAYGAGVFAMRRKR
jgi:hypothetical protein